VLRIGYDACLVGPNKFGVGKHILELARSLGRRGEVDLVLYLRQFAHWHDGIVSAPGSSVRRVTSPSFTSWRALRILWQQLALPPHAKADAIDVFHATAYTMPLDMRIPTVLTVFDCLAFERPELCRPTTRWHYRAVMPASVRRANRVIVPSSAVRDSILNTFHIPEGRVVVVPPGIDPQYFAEPEPDELNAVRRRYQLPERFVLFVGKVEPKKNLERLIAAFDLASRDGLEGELILVGRQGWGPDPMRSDGTERVRTLGYVPEEDLAVLYRLASEVAVPSLSEGFGMPVLEAMACGALVVASPVPAVLDSDPEAVILTDPGSSESIAEGLLRARRYPEFRPL
jgi:glycosyltransferase involved in cell wall biosynthesis